MNKIIILLFLSLVGCNSSEKERDHQFKWLNKEKLSNNFVRVFTDSTIELDVEEDIGNEINLSDIIKDYSFLKLSTNNNFLIGAIDKIIFNENLIFVLDKYNTESLTVFDKKTGAHIFTINNHGEGPKEFKSIYDFDVDFKNETFYIFDGELLKYIKYNFKGDFISSSKLPFRIGNIRKLTSGSFINFPCHAPNFHLGNFFSDKDIIITDSLFVPKYGGFEFSEAVAKNDYYNRDYFRCNLNSFTYSPRFKEEIFTLVEKNGNYSFNSIIKLDLGKYKVEESEFLREAEYFIEDMRNDNKFYGNGDHFVSQNWIGFRLENFGKDYLSVFYSKKDKKKFSGTKINFDIQGMPMFDFPYSVFGEECVTVVDNNLINTYINLTKDQKDRLRKNKSWSKEFELFLNTIKDPEAPILLFYNLK